MRVATVFLVRRWSFKRFSNLKDAVKFAKTRGSNCKLMEKHYDGKRYYFVNFIYGDVA